MILNVRLLAGAVALAATASIAAAQQVGTGNAYRTLTEALEHETFVEPPSVPPRWLRPEASLPAAGGAPRPTIMLTGYWPPTNEMLRRFSQSPAQNPDGWVGADWEGRGYDVVAFFPEFVPRNCGDCGPGSGDFEVDYQDTSADFWSITPAVRPIAMIIFSRGFPGNSWELEMNNVNWDTWYRDYIPPTLPAPSPPDASWPANGIRNSTLPVQDIVDNVNALGLGLNAYICFTQDGGNFLSGYMGYHGVWYQDLHKDPSDPDWCLTAGHVHVGTSVSWDTGRLAAEETLRTVIDLVDATVAGLCSTPTSYCPAAPNSVGAGATLSAQGLPSLSLNAFSLRAQGLPIGQPGLYYFGANAQNPPLPFGNGFRCVAAPNVRLDPLVSDADGIAQRALDFSRAPTNTFAIGQTQRFQYWYRDPAGGGANFNLSDALEVVFCP